MSVHAHAFATFTSREALLTHTYIFLFLLPFAFRCQICAGFRPKGAVLAFVNDGDDIPVMAELLRANNFSVDTLSNSVCVCGRACVRVAGWMSVGVECGVWVDGGR